MKDKKFYIQGNTAKMYCLNWIERYIEKHGEIRVLDLGCGTAVSFLKLLEDFPEIYYLGIEPSKDYFEAKKNLERLNADVLNKLAYGIEEVIEEKFDLVISFSVLEHVYKRFDYLKSAKACLKQEGYFLINYDSGHSIKNGKLIKKSPKAELLARIGFKNVLKSFVTDKSFNEMIDRLGFIIIDQKFFNTYSLKNLAKIIPSSSLDDFQVKWFDFEIWLNEIGIEYDDSKALIFGTRNYILAKK